MVVVKGLEVVEGVVEVEVEVTQYSLVNSSLDGEVCQDSERDSC